MKKIITKINMAAIATAGLLLLGGALPAYAQLSADDAGAIFNDFQAAFQDNLGGGNGAVYNWSTAQGFDKNDMWENAELIEMCADRYQAGQDTTTYDALNAAVNGFDYEYGNTWTSDTYNDDIMWACLAHARAYSLMKEYNGTVTADMTSWLNNAENNFNWVYSGGTGRSSPQYDSTYGGGMWENTSKLTKSACANGAGALAAIYIHHDTGNAAYYTKAQNMINWETSHLVSSAGLVSDRYDASGPVGGETSYDAGVYVYAAAITGIGNPEQVAEYFTNNYCTIEPAPYNIRLPNYGTGGGNNDGFNGIFLRWVAYYEIVFKGSTSWNTFFNDQANSAWAAMDTTTGLSWDDWDAPTTGTQYSWDDSVSVTALQVVQWE